MTDELRNFFDKQATELDDKVREVIELCDGSLLSAVYSLIISNTFLHDDNERLREENALLKQQVSAGFRRGKGLA